MPERDVNHGTDDEASPIGALFTDLTEPQAEAVRCTEGPLLVLAAAGSGKTRVITRRIAYLIYNGVPPWQILALTFTNKAAGEMRERVLHLLEGGEAGEPAPGSESRGTQGEDIGADRRFTHAGPGGDRRATQDTRRTRGLTVTTFHSLCARLLRRYAEAAGLKADFTIYDSADQASLCKKVIEAVGLSTSNFPARSVLSAISNAKNELLDADAFAKRAFDFTGRSIAKVYSAYEKALRAANAVDFDDLLVLTAKLLRRDAAVRAEIQQRWQYLMIDEYQDTNLAQFEIASLIAGDVKENGGDRRSTQGDEPGGDRRATQAPNICVVGDPDQAIYGWRGADITNILEFEEHYPSAKVIKLGENFRSTTPILTVADTLIQVNKRRKHKPLFTQRKGGDKVECTLCRDEHHETTLVVDWFKKLHEDGDAAWRDMAVFYRTNALSRVIEEALRGAGVPYTIARGTAFYEREEVKSALAYLRLVANMADDVSLLRIVNVPARGIGDTSMTKIEEWAAGHGVPVLAAMREREAYAGISARSANAAAKFVEMMDGWTGGGTFMGAEGRPVSGSLAELVDRVVRESGLYGMYKAQAAASGSDSDAERLDNLDELVSSAREFENEYDPANDPANFAEAVGATNLVADVEDPTRSVGVPEAAPLLPLLRAYLESISLVADADTVDPSQGSVTLMTLHAAKGLEFHSVAMIGLEEGMLPHARAVTSGSDDDMEEERRLCFVGITRAMRRLHITSSKYRTMRGIPERTIPSRFLTEFGSEHVLFSDQSDALADLDGTEWGRDTGQYDTSRGGMPRGLDSPASPPSVGTKIAKGLPVGAMVRHPQFGLGKVLTVTGGVNARATIQFKDVGVKTLVLEYARLTRV